MEDMKMCQCCAMPMEDTNEMYGTNKDGSKTDDYCSYCYKDGNFTADISMEEMIKACVPHMVEANKGMTEETATEMMNKYFPKLKRWKKN